MKLLIRNLARTTTEVDLRKIFEAHGPVQSCNLVLDKQTGKSKGFAFIEMPRPGDAKAAVKMLNGTDMAGNIIRVKKAAQKKPAVKNNDIKTAKPEKARPQKPSLEESTTVNRNIWSSND